MVFNSFEFILFFGFSFALYWLWLNRQSVAIRNLFLIGISYLFYGWWDYRFLALIVASSLADFLLGRYIGQQTEARKRKWGVALSLTINLGLLGFFKYYNFFIDSFSEIVTQLGFQVNPYSLQIILPVGISFYTFQTLSYTLDVYRGNIEPAKDAGAFFAYVSFFPQLVAGPIERASTLLPQFYTRSQLNSKEARLASRLILWGFFKKMVVADQAAVFANEIFSRSGELSTIELVLGTVLFAFQIYGDFSGYSDIAIGTARLFGFRLMTNFKTPYFARDIAEFWRRWHISLSTWFRDYLYIPLGGSRGSKGQQFRNVLVIFLVSGLWHGANWTFVAWGGLHALFFLPLLFLNRNRNHLTPLTGGWPSLRNLFAIGTTFALVCLAWVFFRAQSMHEALEYLQASVTNHFLPANFRYIAKTVWIWIGLLILVDWKGQNLDYALDYFDRFGRYRIWFDVAILFLILTQGVYLQSTPFIYFQF